MTGLWERNTPPDQRLPDRVSGKVGFVSLRVLLALLVCAAAICGALHHCEIACLQQLRGAR